MGTVRHTLLLLLTLVCRVEPVVAICPDVPLLTHPPFQEEARPAIDSLYNRQPAAGVDLLEPWMVRCPDHPVWELWEAMELWWLVLEDLENEQLDDQLVHRLERSDEKGAMWVETRPDSPDGWFVRALSNGLLARLHANRGRWIRSVLIARDARNASEELERRSPGLADHQLARGLTLYYSAWLPERYAVLRPFRWAIPEGDRELGLVLLASARRDALFVRAEAIYFLGLIQLRYEGRPEIALESFRDLAGTYPKNEFYQRILIHVLVEVAQSAEQNAERIRARELYREAADRSEEYTAQEEVRQAREVAIRALERLGGNRN